MSNNLKNYGASYGVTFVIALVVSLGVFWLVGNQSADPNLGATGTRFPNGLSTDSTSPSSGQVRTTSLTVTGASTLGDAGVAVNDLLYGTCNGITYASLATSTPIDCAVTNAVTTDTNVLMWLATAGTSDNAQFGITAAKASSTNGYITGRIFQIGNIAGTGAGFTATTSYSQATTSIRYLIIR